MAKDWRRGSRLGEHEHLDIEDPSFGVHVGDDIFVWFSSWGMAYLDNGLTADQMGTAANSNAAIGSINNFLTSFNELASITKARSSIGIGEQDVFAPHMSETMSGCSTLASVALK
ncbi:hypothetical protein HG531_006240 [Fusarium graminearum]|nr:hypothetical protein HG531_006240 [Fusarium graminearum]